MLRQARGAVQRRAPRDARLHAHSHFLSSGVTSDILWVVPVLRIQSVEEPFDSSVETYRRSIQLFLRAYYMGHLGADDAAHTYLAVNRRCFGALTRNLRDAGIVRDSIALAGQDWTDRTDELLAYYLEAIESSPHPEGEWGVVRETLGDELLGDLLEISDTSLRRYAAGTRITPDDVAWRLHVVARILSALAGSYNDYGMRRWFLRPRTALDGQTPLEIVKRAESEESPELRRLIDLADAIAAPSLGI
jgi:hypothetical protein